MGRSTFDGVKGMWVLGMLGQKRSGWGFGWLVPLDSHRGMWEMGLRSRRLWGCCASLLLKHLIKPPVMGLTKEKVGVV